MFLYQIKNETITVLGCRSYGGLVGIPDTIDGKTVTELAAYAFSEGWGRQEMLKTAGKILLADSEGNARSGIEIDSNTIDAGSLIDTAIDTAIYAAAGIELPPAACCGHLEEIILPRTIKKIGNYAFYNCFELNTVRCYSTIEDVGAGLFTGCTSIRHMDICVIPGRRSCFKELISELRQELYVNYYVEQGEESVRAKLVFPEMFEESVENTPARIIMREMHGCGHLYRYCFEQTEFCFSKYDALFPHIKVQEPERVVCALVMGRLKYLVELAKQYRRTYEEYLREHMAGAAEYALSAGDLECFTWLAVHYAEKKEALDEMIELAVRKGETEALSGLMDLRHRRFPAKKRTFSL